MGMSLFRSTLHQTPACANPCTARHLDNPSMRGVRATLKSRGCIHAASAPCAPPIAVRRSRGLAQTGIRAQHHAEPCSVSDQSGPAAQLRPYTVCDCSPLPSGNAIQGQHHHRLISTAVRACVLAAGVLLCGQALAPAVQAATDVAAGHAGGNALSGLVSFILHLDKHLSAMIEQHGQTTYAILFAIVFAETGLVLTPFLPGDSLLFAAGAFAGMGKLDVTILMLVFLTSAILGDAVNYAVGNKLGSWAVGKKLVKQEYIVKTEKFYDKYGGKTVVLARFVPIIRTFAPFVAGVGSMPYGKFAMYNVLGAVIWSVLFVGAGFFFGNLPFVQKNFTLVVLAIVAVSVVPVIIELINAKREEEEERRKAGGPGSAAA